MSNRDLIIRNFDQGSGSVVVRISHDTGYFAIGSDFTPEERLQVDGDIAPQTEDVGSLGDYEHYWHTAFGGEIRFCRDSSAWTGFKIDGNKITVRVNNDLIIQLRDGEGEYYEGVYI